MANFLHQSGKFRKDHELDSLKDGAFIFSNDTVKQDLALLIQALDSSISGIILTDNRQPDNPIIYCNKAFERISGYQRHEIIGHNCRFLQKEDRQQKERTTLRRAVEEGSECVLEIRNYKKDGTLFWNELYMSPIKDEQGGVCYFIGVQNDITRRKKAEQELLHQQTIMESQIRERTKSLKESEDYLSSIVQTVRESLVVLDPDFKVLSVNEHFLKTFKVTKEETEGKLLYELGNRQWDIPQLKELLENILPTNNPVEEFEVTHDFPHIGTKLMLLNAHRIELEGQYKDRILIAIEDITERREIERRKDDFLSIASHELKTPLTTIKGYVQVMQRLLPAEVGDKTIGQMEKTSEKVWANGHEEAIHPDEELGEKVDTEAPEALDVKALLKAAPKSAAPTKIKPMKATLVDEAFNEPGWLYEVKWDGYRAIAVLDKKEGVQLISRNNLPFDKYYPINEALKAWKMNAVLDGELMVINEKGISDFGAMQNWRSEADGNLVFYIFDILWYEGKNLADLPLAQRVAILGAVLPTDNEHIRQSKAFDADGIEFFAAAEKAGLEGIIAKKADSHYTSDLRSKEWLKIKVQRRQEVIIAGFTKNAGTSKPFSALLLAVYKDGKLSYAGKVGTGFSDKLQKELMAQFKPLIRDKSPFDHEIDVDKPSRFRPQRLGAKPTWLKPELICEVNYAEVTDEGVFRQASFKGMREDKKAKDVVLEKPAGTAETVHDLSLAPIKNTGRKTLLNPTEDTQVKKVCGHQLKFNHVTKLYWPEDKITKGDMLNYYYKVGEFMIPYLKDRPMSLNRFPGGIHGKSFYQKNVTDKAPDWAKTFDHVTDEGKVTKYLVGTDEASLLWMNSLGCIEINPWFSRAKTPDNPDYCVIDLDPDKQTYDQVVQAAQEVRKVLDAIGVPSYPKTSGSTGMHIYIPLGAKYSYDQSQLFANIIVKQVHAELSDFTSLERSVAARKGKMYLDYLQNRPGATIAGPYSLRPKPGATVSMPLSWDEVKPGLSIKQFNIHNALDRLKESGDLFHGVLGKGIDLAATLKKAKSVFK